MRLPIRVLRTLCTSTTPVNHFRTLNLPERFTHTPTALRDALLLAQRRSHPDLGGSASDSSSANAAYAVLRKPLARAAHLLEVRGLSAAAEAPPALLMRVVEMREEVEGMKSSGLRGVKERVEGEIAECMNVVQGIDEGGDGEVVAEKVVEVRYLERVLEAVQKRQEDIGMEG